LSDPPALQARRDQTDHLDLPERMEHLVLPDQQDLQDPLAALVLEEPLERLDPLAFQVHLVPDLVQETLEIRDHRGLKEQQEQQEVLVLLGPVVLQGLVVPLEP